MKKKLLLLLAVIATAITASAENYILYTSLDGNVVTPYYSEAFDMPIVSNTYENGQGKIVFDGEVTEIRGFAFGWCTSLTSVVIPNSVTSIGHLAFAVCFSLKKNNIVSSYAANHL